MKVHLAMLIFWRYDRGDFECRGGGLVNQQSEGIFFGNIIEWSELVILVELAEGKKYLKGLLKSE